MEHTASYSGSSDWGRLHFYITGSEVETSGSARASASITFTATAAAQGPMIELTSFLKNTGPFDSPSSILKQRRQYRAMTESVSNGATISGVIRAFSASSDPAVMASNLAEAITNVNGHRSRMSVSQSGNTLFIFQANEGQAGNLPVSGADGFNNHIVGTLPTVMVGGRDAPGRMLSASTDYLPLYNGDFWNISLSTNKQIKPETTASNNLAALGQSASVQDVVFQITAKLAADHADGKITHSGSAELRLDNTIDSISGRSSGSYLRSWTLQAPYKSGNESAVFIGGVNDSEWITHGITHKFSGSMQEYSQYTEELEDDILDIHTLSPQAIVGNHFTSSFDKLIRRYPMGTDLNDLNHNTFVVISSSHPQQAFSEYTDQKTFPAHGTASGFNDIGSGKVHYENFDELYYTTMPDIIGERPVSHKIRIEDNTLTSQSLQPIFTGVSVETSSFDTHPLDSNRLSVGLSPSQNINLDIAYQFGNLSLDDFVGDPRDEYKTEYTTLSTVQDAYFKKFSGAYNVAAFSRLLRFFDKSLWQQIESLVPARANAFIGLIIEPTILERPKIKRTRPSFESLYYTASVSVSCIHTATVPTPTSKSNSGSLSVAAYGTLDDDIELLVSDGGHRYKEQGSIYRYGVNTGSGAYETTQSVELYGVLTSVTSSRVSETWQDLEKFFFHPSSSGQDRHMEAAYSAAADNFYSSSRKFAEVQDYRPRQIKNLYYDGVQIFSELTTHSTGSGTGSVYLTFPSAVDSGSTYADSTDTPDGQPVIEVFTVNPNTVVVGGTPSQVSQVPTAVNSLNLANLTMAPPEITLATGKGGVAGVNAAVKGATSAVANVVSNVVVSPPSPPSPYIPTAPAISTKTSYTATAKTSTATTAKSNTVATKGNVSFAKGGGKGYAKS